MSTAMELAFKRALDTSKAKSTGLVKPKAFIRESVRLVRGRPVTPDDVATNLSISEDEARTKALSVMRKHLREMAPVFEKQKKGAPKLQELRASVPLDVVIEAYEWYRSKAIRMASRWQEATKVMDERIGRLKRQQRKGDAK